METTLKLINADELGMYAPAKSSFNVPTTVMSGKLRATVTELNKTEKKEQADALTKRHTFTVNLDFTRMPISQIIKLAASPQSLIVSLQNGLLRPMGDAVIEKIANGDEVDIPVSETVKFSAKNKVLYVLVKSWISRPKTANGMSPEDKLEKQFGNLSDDQQILFIAKRFMAKDDTLSLEDAVKKAKDLM